MRSGVESICNPHDLVAAEAAVRLAEKHGGKVTVITMGPPQAESALMECLALGADRAILLSGLLAFSRYNLKTGNELSYPVGHV